MIRPSGSKTSPGTILVILNYYTQHICLSAHTSAVVFFRQWYHVRGSSSNRTRQSTQTGQKGTDVLHCRTATGQTHTDLSRNVSITQLPFCFCKCAELSTQNNQISAAFDFFISIRRSCRLSLPRTTIQMPRRYRN